MQNVHDISERVANEGKVFIHLTGNEQMEFNIEYVSYRGFRMFPVTSSEMNQTVFTPEEK